MQKALMLLVFLFVATYDAAAADRVALVIGNASYDGLARLPNSRNDAIDMGAALESHGFDVQLATDLGLSGMRAALQRFKQKLSGSSVALIYFSGHGVQVDGENFLVPIDASVRTVEDVPKAAVSLAEASELLRGTDRSLNVVILDACSDNGLETRDGQRVTGLARASPPPNGLLAFAADIGQLASAGFRRHSLYTESLLENISTLGLRLEDIFNRTRQEVKEISRGDQVPVEFSALTKPLDLGGEPVSGGGKLLVRLPTGKDPQLDPGETFFDCEGCPPMIVLPVADPPQAALGGAPGSNLQPYAISQHEVTIGEWNQCAAEVSDCKPRHGQDNIPVGNISWEDAEGFLNWLSAKTNRRYRLPTEAEWVYAARANTTTDYHWGDEPNVGKAHCKGCGSPYDTDRPVPVASFEPNAWRIYDMHGNMWEWVSDCPDVEPDSGYCGRSLLRGGSWAFPANRATWQYRAEGKYQRGREDFGLRLARSIIH